jgi:DNA-binding CsgD family transcriptional regulator
MVDAQHIPANQLYERIREGAKGISERALPKIIIVDCNFRILLISQPFWQGKVCSEYVDVEAMRLRPQVEKVVREIVAGWNDPALRATNCFGVIPPSGIVRVVALGGAQSYIAILIEQIRHWDSLRRAAKGYSLSPRETEVLSLILEGASAPEIANLLCLAESTVQSYFKHLLSKTNSRNRPSMVAKVLGWDGLPAASRSEYPSNLLRSRWSDGWVDVDYNREERAVPS